MLSEIFYWVLNLSILGSICGCLVLLISKIPKIPPFLTYLLWFVPLVRFYIPFGIANKYSLLSLISKFTTKTVAISPDLTISNYLMVANSYFPITYKTSLLEKIFSVSSLIWVIIAAALIIAMLLLYFSTKSELKNAEHIKDNIYKSDKILSPAIYGIIKPKIIIPAILADSDITFIVMHETTHIKRCDNLWRSVAIFTACIHWFNPLSWVLIKRYFADMEFACDSAILKNLQINEQKEYAQALLCVANGKTFFASAFSGAKTKLRIEKVLSYKKLAFFSSLCFVSLFIIITAVLLTNAA